MYIAVWRASNYARFVQFLELGPNEHYATSIGSGILTKWYKLSMVLAHVVVALVSIICKGYSQECAPDGIPGEDIDPCDLFEPCIKNYVVPSETSCTKYRMCTSGLWIEKDCPPPMQFSQESYICCVGMDPSECFGECPPTTEGTDPPNELCDSTPNDCQEGDLAPNRNHCDRYFECIFAVWEPRECPLGTGFDPMTLSCSEDIEEVNCEYRCLTTAAITTTVPTTVTTSQVPTTTVKTSTEEVTYIITEGVTVHTTEELYTDIVVTDISTEGDATSTKTTLSTTDGTTYVPPSGSSVNAILIGSVCGAVGAAVLVIIAILAQNGIITCNCGKKKEPPVLPSSITATRFSTAYGKNNGLPKSRGGLMLSLSVPSDRSGFTA